MKTEIEKLRAIGDALREVELQRKNAISDSSGVALLRENLLIILILWSELVLIF